MKTADFFARVVEPNLQLIATLPGIMIPIDDPARVLVMTIAGQESGWKYRLQQGGPARSFYQFEGAGGGCGEVCSKMPNQMTAICGYLEIPFNVDTVFQAMAWNDTLATTMARLLLWQDAAALPPVGAKQQAWDYYLRNWRPGAPHPDQWSGLYDQSLAAMRVPTVPAPPPPEPTGRPPEPVGFSMQMERMTAEMAALTARVAALESG